MWQINVRATRNIILQFSPNPYDATRGRDFFHPIALIVPVHCADTRINSQRSFNGGE